jgi:phosphoglycolate phosphatase
MHRGDGYGFWLFDLDGTLVDVHDDYVHEVIDEVGDRLGYGFTDRQAETIWHGFGDARSDSLESWGLDPERFWEVFHDVEDPEGRAAATYLHDDAAAVGDIDAPVGLVTHCQQYLTDPVLDHLDIRDWFDSVVCCTEDTGWKPDAAPVRQAMGGLDLNGRRQAGGVLVGDSQQDVGAAWNAGLDAVHVERHGHDRRGHCVLGDHRVEALTALRER